MDKSKFRAAIRPLLRSVATVGLFGLLLCGYLPAQVPTVLSPVPKLQFFDSNGKPLAFGCVFSYQTLSSTQLATYTDYTGTVQNTNPLILNSGGFVGTGGLWLQAGVAYRLVVKSAGGSACSLGSTISTVDGIGGGTTTLTTIVSYAATVTFTDAAQNQLFTLTLTGNATSNPLTAVGIVPPGNITFEITQDAAGGHTFAWPANVIGGATVSSGVNAVTQQTFIWNGSLAYAAGPATYRFNDTTTAFGVTQLYDFGLTANSALCTDVNKQLISSCASIYPGITVNGQLINPGGSGNVNAGAAAHSIALNEGAGAAMTGLTLPAHAVAVGVNAADPTTSVIPDCQDTSGTTNHLNYTQSSDTYTCGTSGVTKDFSASGCSPATSTDASCTGTITISPAFADASYIPQLTINTTNGAFLAVSISGSLAAGSIPYTITCTFNCSVINTPTIYVHAHHN